MPLNLASPGIVVREVDLTTGRVDPSSEIVGAIAAPFQKGPVNEPVYVENERDLFANFGGPLSANKQYESWYVASSYLAYGGNLRVLRSDGADLKNATYPDTADLKIRSVEHYEQLGYTENLITSAAIVARDPGSWGNSLKVCLIDSLADQILTGINTGSAGIAVGAGVTQSLAGVVLPGAGTTSVLTGHIKGMITEIGSGQISVKVLEYVDSGTSSDVDYENNGVYKFSSSGSVAITSVGQTISASTTAYTAQKDWYDQQYISLPNNQTIYWNNIAEKPTTTNFAKSRSSRFDELHVVVIDNDGGISGVAGNILEKNLGLSKGTDAEYSLGSPSYWRKYIQLNSSFIYGGRAPSGILTTSYSSNFVLDTEVDWDQETQGTNFANIGNLAVGLSSGRNYDGGEVISADGSMAVTVADLSTAYDQISNSEEIKVDFIMMGGAHYEKVQSQSLANKLISIANDRKDALVFISPYREAFINDSGGGVVLNSAAEITENVIGFYSPVTSSSYAVFDSGYKYMYDRFNDAFRYVPLNGDIAGLCARNDIESFPWFSPAGTSRGSVLNAVKLAYNPNQTQRDKLYSNRINPVVFSPGSGIVLFGDRTALGKASAFDRINVRRLFIYLQDVISEAAKSQLFEFNDEITRTNFVNIVEPFLRDVQAKRGLFDYRVICDESNNTATVIDNNEFVADIYVQPTRSINFIGLTFVATRTGVQFDEVIGNV